MENLQITDFIKYKFISSLQLSPNNEFLAFIVTKPSEKNNNYNNAIWIMDIETKKYKKLLNLKKTRDFQWLDNEKILFLDASTTKKIENDDECSVYYCININSKQITEFMQIPLDVDSLKQIDENNFVLTADYNPNKKTKQNEYFELIDEIPFWLNGSGYNNKIRTRLYIYNKVTNSLTALTDEFTNIVSYELNQNKTQVLYIGKKYINKKGSYNSLNIYNLQKNENEELIQQKEYSIEEAFFIEDKIIIALSNMKSTGLNQNHDFYIYQNNKLKLFAKHDTGLGNTICTDCEYGGGTEIKIVNNEIYLISTIGKSSFLRKLNSKGEYETLTKDNGSVVFFDTDGENTFFVGMKNNKLQEIYTLQNGIEKQTTNFNEKIIKEKNISSPEHFTFINSDKIEIDGFVIKPINYNKNKTYPAILNIHGGPMATYGDVFYHEMQVWANMGYFVMFSNPRGSDGKGDAFADIRGKYGTIDYNDLMEFTNEVLLKYPQINKNKLAVTGGSYGGYMTNWIIGHTNKFSCAVSQRSISNWISKFGTTDIGYFFNPDQLNCTPWDNYDKMWWHSPLKYADKVKTPTLFIHSDKDYRCDVTQGLQMFTALKYHNIDAKICIFKGENHELSRSGKPKARIKRLCEISNWFNKYLK